MQQQRLRAWQGELHSHRHPALVLPNLIHAADRPTSRRHHHHRLQPATATASIAPLEQQQPRPRLVLGIESSCDDTGVAVVTSDGRVLGEALATQAEIHAPWGGVVPNLAMDAHKAAIDRVVDEALRQAGVTADQLDAVAVTVGPGLGLCLRVGALKALQLSATHQLPLVRVHHMEAHALVARMVADPSLRPSFPFLCLLVSGGHNLLVLVRGVGQYVQLGTTLDDALGEAYDKIARLLGLDLRPSGGAALEALARQGDPLAFKFVVPMRRYGNCDFSYAGLKTSVRLAIEANLGLAQDLPGPQGQAQALAPTSGATLVPNQTLPEQALPDQAQQPQGAVDAVGLAEASQGPGHSPTSAHLDHSHSGASSGGAGGEAEEAAQRQKLKADIAASFQRSATLHLVERVTRAVTWARETDPDLRHLVVAGGVACNQHIRAQLTQAADKAGLTLVLPAPKWCTDNGAMVAWAGIERMDLGLQQPPPDASQGAVTDDTWVDLWPRWPLTSTKHPRCELPVNQAPQNRKVHAPEKYGQRSARKARLHTSLTDMTAEALAGRVPVA